MIRRNGEARVDYQASRFTQLLVAVSAAAIVCMEAGVVSAKIYSPWILSEHVADMRDEVRFAADPRWAHLEGQEKALAVWRYLTDRETGTWHFADMWEGREPHWESKLVKDPVKILNVYGFGVCTMQASMMEGLYEALGYEVRQQDFGGYHRIAEIEWDGSWHYLDIDERAYLIDEQGRVVSVEEAVADRGLWEHSALHVSPFYPQNKGIKGIEELAKRKPPVTHWHWRTLGHTMDFSLRPGESLTRYWKGQDRWRMSEAWRSDGTLKIVKKQPAGPKTGERVSVNNTYGNAEWAYEPKLSPEYADFQQGVYRRNNVELEESGLTLESAGEAWAEWRVQTPYIIVGKPNDLLDPDDDEGAVIVTLSGEGALSLSVSTDQGRTWEQAWTSEGGTVDARVDLTRWTAGRYEYHLRLFLRGEPGASRLSSICITTWAQVAPMSLPRLKEGANRLQFAWGDRHGLAAEAAIVEPFLGDRGDAERWAVRVDGSYHPSDRTSRARGPVTVRVDALEGSKIRWLHIGGSFNTGRPRGRPEPDRILYSTAPEGLWRAIREAVPPPWNDHWYYNAEVDVLLDEPASRLWVRLEPASAVNAVRVYPHCEPEGASQEGPLLVTHAFRIAGELTGETRRLEGPGIYEIECPGEPENVYVKMMVPPRARASALPSS
jgi:hypothetical protein